MSLRTVSGSGFIRIHSKMVPLTEALADYTVAIDPRGPPHELWFAHRRIAFISLDGLRPVVDVEAPPGVTLSMGSGGEHRFGARVLTFAAAAAALAPLVAGAGAPSAPGQAPDRKDTPGVRTVRIEPDVARRLAEGLQLFVRSYNSLRHDTVAHAGVCPLRYSPAPCPVAELNAFRELLLHDILGNPRDPPRGRTP